MTNAILRGKPDAGNPHVRFDEGEVASAKPRRGSLLYSYSCVMNEGNVQTLRIPSEFRLNSVHVVVESSGDGILVRPVKSKMSVSELFGMIDDARRQEGDLEIDRSSNVPSAPQEIF